jgi:DNA-binding GntR family transcriptional regulator
MRTNNFFEELKLAIMRGVFKPRERLVERELAEQFAVSRTPIREAIRKLESIGMVRIVPNQGAKVADFSPKDIDALFQMRIYLEKFAVKLACSDHCHGDIKPAIKALRDLNAQLIKAVASDDFAKIVEFDQKFHLVILGLSKNPYLMRAIEELRLRSYPISYYLWKSKKNLRTSLAEHKRMIKSLERKDIAELTAIVEKQLNNAKNSYLEYLNQQV